MYNPDKIKDPWNTKWEDMDAGYRVLSILFWIFGSLTVVLASAQLIAAAVLAIRWLVQHA